MEKSLSEVDLGCVLNHKNITSLCARTNAGSFHRQHFLLGNILIV
jgi:hypothetical protein